MRVAGIAHEKKGVIFDMDGLMVNSEELYWKANIQASNEYHLGLSPDTYLKLVGAPMTAMDEFYHKYFKNGQEREAFIKRTDDLVDQWTREGRLELKPGVNAALNRFGQLGLTIGLASSNYEKVIEQNLWVTGSRNCFDFILSHDDVVRRKIRSKPAPDVYLAAQEKSGLAKAELLVFEDSSTGVEAAYNAGLDVVMIPDLLAPKAADQERASMICKDFWEFLEKIR